MAVSGTASPRVTDVAPILQLPPFRALLTDEEDNHLDIDNGSATSDEHTKKSFDFTGELKRLNESGASERRSFVEHSAIQSKWISVMTSVVTFESRFHPCRRLQYTTPASTRLNLSMIPFLPTGG